MTKVKQTIDVRNLYIINIINDREIWENFVLYIKKKTVDMNSSTNHKKIIKDIAKHK